MKLFHFTIPISMVCCALAAHAQLPHNGNSRPVRHTNAQVWQGPGRECPNGWSTTSFRTWGIEIPDMNQPFII